MDVTLTANATSCHHDTLSRLGEISYLVEYLHGLWVELSHLRAQGNLEDKVLPVGAMATGALAMRATAGSEVMLKSIFDE